LILNITVKGRW